MLKDIINWFKNIKGNKAAKEYVPDITKLSPKDAATALREPWVAVLDTHINKENVRNGFFELDWNDYFIVQLRDAGYRGETDEAIVDAWFKDLCRDVASEEAVPPGAGGFRQSGYINVTNLGNGKSEIS
jgi:hypothetical protein